MHCNWIILPALLLLGLPTLRGQETEDLKFEITRPGLHGSETAQYREIGIGEWGVAWNVFYTIRSYNVTDIRGLDQSLATNWLYSFDPVGLGLRTHIEYRLSPEWRLSFIPRADVALGILNESYHNTHGHETLPLERNYRGANDVQKLSLNLDFEFTVRWRYLWFINKVNIWAAFRRREIRAHETVFSTPQLGPIDKVKDRESVEWEQAYLFGAGTGLGFEFYFLDESTRFMVFALWRPFNNVSFRGAGGYTNGFEVGIRSSDFELSDQFGLYFEANLQMYLNVDHEFGNIYYTQFSLGVKFR